MIKKYSILAMSLFFISNASEVSASSISYTIINSVTATSTSVAVSTIKERTFYTCDTTLYTCIPTSQTVAATTTTPLTEVTLNELLEKERNTTTTQNISVAPTLSPQVHGVFTLPSKAVSVTPSPDGKKIAYYLTEDSMVKTYHTYKLMFDDGKTLEKFGIMNNWDLVTDNTPVFRFTNDSNTLIYLDDRSGFQQLYMVDLLKDQKNLLGEPLITKKYTVFDFVVKGDSVYFIANRASSYAWGLYSLDLITKKLTEISSHVMYTNNLVVSGDTLLYTIEKDGQGILTGYDIKTKTTRVFNGINSDTVPVLTYTILKNKNINGILITPEENEVTSKKKAIVWLHGGPYRQASPQRHSYGSYATYDWMLDELVKEGVTVLKLDYPGSVGFGRNFSESLVGNIGKVDVRYVQKAITYLNSQGIKDVYLFGNSYGGYLSLKGATELNTKISGAIAAASVTDWQKLIEKISPTPFEAHFGGAPTTKNQKLYDTASIVLKKNTITKPIMLFHGNLDKQIPFNQSEYLFKTLKEAGKDITYYSVLGQAHVYSGVSQNEAICQKVAEFIGIHSSSTTFCTLE